MKPPRILRPNTFAYIRVRLVANVQDIFGEWEVEPINKFGTPVFPGKYLYAMESEIVTVDEVKKAVKA